ncbi:MAG: ATP-binding protein, partial [Pseudomonadota bacterium]|nr:ATP-binding protein [Pseudomonadota bacterium]
MDPRLRGGDRKVANTLLTTGNSSNMSWIFPWFRRSSGPAASLQPPGLLPFALEQCAGLLFRQDRGLRYTWIHIPSGTDPHAALSLSGKTDPDIYSPADARLLADLKQRVLRTGETVRQTVTLSPGNRTTRTYAMVLAPATENGAVTGLWGMLRDRSEEAAQMAVLEKTRAEIMALGESKARFFTAASHDLRQPFQAMALFLHLLQNRLTTPDQQELAAKLGESLRSGEQMLGALLDVTALDGHTVRPLLKTLPVGDLLQQVREALDPAARAKGLQLVVLPCRRNVVTDPDLLAKLLYQLVRNAIDNTDRGRVLVGCRPRGNRLKIMVCDTGRGIPEQDQALVFEDFWQKDNNQRDRGKGLGLGLTIVSRISRLLDLDARIDSSIAGRGTVFSFHLPLSAGVSHTHPRIAAGTGTGLAGKKVLVVEDDVIQLMALEMMLEDWGAVPLAASRAEAALEAIHEKNFRPDIV